LKLDAEVSGWEAVFMPWKIKVLKAIYDYPSGITSATAWKAIKKERSRASVIIYLEELKEEGILTSVQRSGRGGFHSVYSPVFTADELKRYVAITFRNQANNLLLEELI
jgi:hypothetical protein